MTSDAPPAMAIHATATNTTPAFEKYLYSWPVPGGDEMLTGVTGTLSTNASKDSFNEALFALRWLPTGQCPRNGESYSSYADISRRYPDTKPIINHIVKNPTVGPSSLQVGFTLPHGVHVTNCIIAILDGSILSGGRYTMTVDLQMHFAMPNASVAADRPEGLSDEFCFGTQGGCGQWHTTNNDAAFASYSAAVKQPTELVAVHGDTSSSPLSVDLRKRLGFDLVHGSWSVTNSLYVVANCSGRPVGKTGPGVELVPGGSEILRTTMTGSGMTALQQTVHKNLSAIVIPIGGCVAHEIRRTGTGGINAEYQVTLFTRPTKEP